MFISFARCARWLLTSKRLKAFYLITHPRQSEEGCSLSTQVMIRFPGFIFRGLVSSSSHCCLRLPCFSKKKKKHIIFNLSSHLFSPERVSGSITDLWHGAACAVFHIQKFAPWGGGGREERREGGVSKSVEMIIWMLLSVVASAASP